jgi:ParB family chromosome partitioning protein
LIENGTVTRDEAAVRLGMAQSTLANKLRLLKLTKEERSIILRGGLLERHARALLKIANEDKRKEVLAKAAAENWTVETTEKYILKLEREEIKKNSYEKRAVLLKDVRLFFNTVNKAVEVMKMAGVEAQTKKVNCDGYIEYTIKIPTEGVQSDKTEGEI